MSNRLGSGGSVESWVERPAWRSMLYVPVTVRRFTDKAHARGADAIQLDLEDGVAASEKAEARRLLPAVIGRLASHRVDVVVRVNRPWRQAVRDLEAAVGPGLRAVALPKVDSPEHVRAVADVLSELEAECGLSPGSVGIIALIESPGALTRLAGIAAASPRLIGMNLGAEDFATESGFEPHEDLLWTPKLSVVFAARAAGIHPFGLTGTLANYGDLDALRLMVRESRRRGFVGASAIHPSQVPVLNEGFMPEEHEIETARQILDEFERASAASQGAFGRDGKMYDAPMIRRAESVVARFEALQRLETERAELNS